MRELEFTTETQRKCHHKGTKDTKVSIAVAAMNPSVNSVSPW